MRRIALATASTVAGIVALLSLKPHQSTPVAVAVTPTTTSSSSSSPSSSSSSSSAKSTSSTKSTPTKTVSSTKTVTGNSINTRYGNIQLKVTITNGKITAIDALQTPSDEDRSVQISSYAIPQLTQEALSAQSVSIDAVSGASYTSAGYIQALQSALDKANA